MFQLFHKEGRMVKETQHSVHGKGTAALIFQMALIMLLSEVAVLCIVNIMSAIGKSTSLVGGKSVDGSQLSMLFMTFATIMGFLLASRYVYRRSNVSLGLKRERLVFRYGMGLLIGFVQMASAVGIAYLGGGLAFEGFSNPSLWIIALYFLGFMIQGFNEELMMRGFFMNAYAAKHGMARAIFVNSILFAALHLANDGISLLAFLNLILAGIVFSLMAVYFDNIIVCSAAHTMWNFAQGNLFGVLVSGLYLPSSLMGFKNMASLQWLNGGAFGLEGGVAVTLVEVACILVFCYMYQRKLQRTGN